MLYKFASVKPNNAGRVFTASFYCAFFLPFTSATGPV